MTPLRIFSICLVTLYLLVYFLDLLTMTSISFDVKMYCRFSFKFKLANWVISDPLIHKGLKNWKLVDSTMGLFLLKKRKRGFPMFTNSCITFVFSKMLNVSFGLSLWYHFVVLIHQKSYFKVGLLSSKVFYYHLFITYLLIFYCFKDSPSKMMKNAFHLKSSFHSQDIEFLSWLFLHVEKIAWLER